LSKRLDRSILQTEVVQIFNAAIKSSVTRDVYERRLLNFLNHMEMTPGEFVALAKDDPSGAEKKIIAFALELEKRHERAEIAAGTVHNCVKCVRLLLEMNDIYLNWKKISRILPKVRRYALDRIPTTEEISEILDASDIRGKALTLVLVSSGIREGAIETLHVGDYTPIRSDGQTVAGRLVVYAGHPEQYVALVTFEACVALDKYLEFRKGNNENITNTSPLFRDTFDPISSYHDNKCK
jgi:integrase